MNQKKLDTMVQKLTYIIESITEQCCPTIPAKLINKNNPWWTPQISDLRKEVTALYRKYIHNKTDRLYMSTIKKFFVNTKTYVSIFSLTSFFLIVAWIDWSTASRPTGCSSVAFRGMPAPTGSVISSVDGYSNLFFP